MADPDTPDRADDAPGDGAGQDPAAVGKPGRFEPLKLYLKDASFESPLAPGIFTEPGAEPKFETQLGLDINVVHAEQGIHEIVLKVTVTAAVEERTVYLAEVQQAGIFRIVHPEAARRARAMEVACPQVLLPFAREALAGLVTKGGFHPFLLAPVNFEALHQAKQPDTPQATEPAPH